MILSENKKIKRLAIYFFYDKDGVVDSYVPFMLEKINECVSEIMIVCNGKLTSDSRKKLEEITKNIYVRDNTGFDVWAYKEAMQVYGMDRIRKFDELILMNSTIMGPIESFSDMFNEMEKEDVDFWGITAHHRLKFDPFGKSEYGYIPKHIQSHFIAIRNKMLNSIEFQKYWDKVPEILTYEDTVSLHEGVFTKKFEEQGYEWKVYVDTEDLEEHSYNPMIHSPRKLVENKKCPVFKRGSFFHDYNNFLNLSNGEMTYELMEYLKEKTTFDTNMIWENILRTQNQADIKKNLQLNYILSTENLESNVVKEKKHKIALVIHMYFEDLIDSCLDYAMSMPDESNIYITTGSEKMKKRIHKSCTDKKMKNVRIILIENRGRDVSALLVATKDFIMNYDYVCFAHDKKVTQLDQGIKGEAFSYKCFENILKNKCFVENIINTFEKNEKLGLLTPPPPNHSDYYPILSFEWGQNFKNTKELYDELELTVPINEKKEPIAPLGTMFWFRPKALKRLFDQDWEYDDFPAEPNDTDGTRLHAIERIYPFVVQEEGFYPAWLMSDSFARIEVTNLSFMLREVNSVAFKLYGFNSHYGLVSTMNCRLYASNSDVEMNFIFKMILKNKVKRHTPKFIWNGLKKTYHLFNGKKWVG